MKAHSWASSLGECSNRVRDDFLSVLTDRRVRKLLHPLPLVAAALVCGFPASLPAAPVEADVVRQAADGFIRIRFPAAAPAVTGDQPPGSSHFQIADVRPWETGKRTIGFVVTLDPRGYVLFRADDDLFPIKSYSEHGGFEGLPPYFVENLAGELEDELAVLQTRQQQATVNDGQRTQWQALKNPAAGNALVWSEFGPSPQGIGGPLVATRWDQGDPYNYYAPAASGGPGGRALAGCVAVAMGQILRYHAHPSAVASNHTYIDFRGSCTGPHAVADVGLGPYEWTNMPVTLKTTNSVVEKQALGRLLYHCAVSVDMDFEGIASGAIPDVAVPALRNYFAYDCDEIRNRSNFTASAWFNLVKTDIVANRPVGYGMYDTNGFGHALVCDGYNDSGTMIHLNFGWGGTADAWYSVNNTIFAGGHSYLVDYQGAIFNIRPQPPRTAVSPFPIPGGADIPCAISCTWSNGGNAKGYRVYFGTNLNLTAADLKATRTDTNRQYDPGLLGGSTPYYWRVDATNGGGVTTGTVWSFTTAPETCLLAVGGGPHGNLSPSGNVLVAFAGQTTIVIRADAYYQISNVWVNGQAVGPTPTVAFTNVRSNQTLWASFAENLAAHGTPEWWLAKYGWTNNFDAAATNDADRDRMPSWAEYRAGTDPTNRGSFLGFASIVPAASSPWISVSWQSVSGKFYRLERGTNLTCNPAFGILVRTNIPGNSPMNTETDKTAVDRGPWLYRIRLE